MKMDKVELSSSAVRATGKAVQQGQLDLRCLLSLTAPLARSTLLAKDSTSAQVVMGG
jgi:hypothetical protein